MNKDPDTGVMFRQDNQPNRLFAICFGEVILARSVMFRQDKPENPNKYGARERRLILETPPGLGRKADALKRVRGVKALFERDCGGTGKYGCDVLPGQALERSVGIRFLGKTGVMF